MFDLIYNNLNVELLPRPTADNPAAASKIQEEMFPIIDEQGYVIAKTARSYAHSGSHLLHPVVHLHIIDRFGCLYLQKRSMKKHLLPGKWDTAVGGHISFGEHLMEALYREASEELGSFDFNPCYIKSYVYENAREKEMVNVFATIGHFDLKPSNDEVDEGKYWKLEDIDAELGKDVFTPQFEQEYKDIRTQLEALL